jgi:hypothetical protein
MSFLLRLRAVSVLAWIGAAIAACADAPNEASETGASSALVSDIASMTQRADGKFDVVCKDGSREIDSSDQIVANQACSGGGSSGDGGLGSATRIVIYGTSDHCDSNAIVTSVTATTNCDQLSDSQAAWSVGARGQCVDITDTTVRRACQLYAPGRTVLFGTSDHCDPNAIAASIDSTFDCSSLSDSSAAWSILQNGQCVDISDTTLRRACQMYAPGHVVIFGASDHCDPNAIVASVSSTSDCNSLSDSNAAWSVLADGQCIDIADTTIRKACIQYQP